MKVACTMWGGGKVGDNFKDLPIVKSVYPERIYTSQGWHTFLAGLNSLLDTCQTVTLPTGEVIQRHPDCVLVITTNTGYQGCKEINNSVISRMQFVKDTELPSEVELMDRIKGITGFNDDTILSRMIKVVNEIHTFCQERMISDGSCGVRELIDWVQCYQVLGNAVESAMLTVIPKASAELEAQNEIKISCLDTNFAGQ